MAISNLVSYVCSAHQCRSKERLMFLVTLTIVVTVVTMYVTTMMLPYLYSSNLLGGWVKDRHISVHEVVRLANDTAIPSTHMTPTSTVKSYSDYVTAKNKTWMIWKNGDRPGTYRACVPRPSEDDMDRVVTGNLIEDQNSMTILKCLEHCSNMSFTYAALGKGRQCYCSGVNGNSSLLKYVDSAHCDVPCCGDMRYNCGGNLYFSLYRTTVKDTRCGTSELKPKGTFPLIALASYPRSGNTWTRSLIERATGYYTGSYYWTGERTNVHGAKIFLGGNSDYKLKRTICVKTHQSSINSIKEFEDGGIVLIRNPYSAMVAEVFRRFKLNLKTALEYFKAPAWDNYVKDQSDRWQAINLHWLTHASRVLFIHYEDMQSNSDQQLVKIVKFLHLTPDPVRITCATQEYPSSECTKIHLGNYAVYLAYDPFTPEQRNRLDGYIKKVNESLAAHQQKTIPSNYNTNTLF